MTPSRHHPLAGNPVALFDSLSGGVFEFFRAPADGFVSDGFVGLGHGLRSGVHALVAGALGGAFEYVTRLTGSFVTILESISGVRVSSSDGDDAATSGQLNVAAAVSLSKDLGVALTGAARR